MCVRVNFAHKVKFGLALKIERSEKEATVQRLN